MAEDQLVAVGESAPSFSVVNQDGKRVRLEDFKGKKLVLFFYPKANTSGCTIESLGFQEALPKFEAKGAVVVGISPDPTEALVDFREKYNLTYDLLADAGAQVAVAYGVWQERFRDGVTSMGIYRSTFVIDEDGKIERVFPDVDVDGHAEEVLATL